jgi:beta-barrel assembly-enhancing protease
MSAYRSLLRRPTAVMAFSAVVATGACAPAITTQQEMQLGAQAAADINRQLPLVTDAAINRYVNDLGRRIARPADPRGIPYNFYVVNSDAVNAFAIPGGHIYVNRGLIERTRNMAEFAGVLAHEVGHVVERHGIDQMQRMQQAELGLNLAYVLLGRQPGTVERAGVGIAGQAWFASHSREAERDADRNAVQYLMRAGINPEGLPSFFEVLLAEDQRTPGVLQWFATHPLTADRLEMTRTMVAQVPAQQRQALTTDNQEFRNFRQRVARLPAAPRR